MPSGATPYAPSKPDISGGTAPFRASSGVAAAGVDIIGISAAIPAIVVADPHNPSKKDLLFIGLLHLSRMLYLGVEAYTGRWEMCQRQRPETGVSNRATTFAAGMTSQDALRIKLAKRKEKIAEHIALSAAQQASQPELDIVHMLARLVDRQLVALPDALAGEQLDRVLVLGRRGVFGADPDRRRRIGSLEIPGASVIGSSAWVTAPSASNSVDMGSGHVIARLIRTSPCGPAGQRSWRRAERAGRDL